MIVMWLLAAHLVGDFMFQSRVHALLKFDDRVQRTSHVCWYVLPFVPLAFIYAPWPEALGFLWCLAGLHWITDSRRFYSNVGDVLAWWANLRHDPVGCKKVWLEHVTERAESAGIRAVDVDDDIVRWPPPNPWPTLPIMIDQTLHVCQLALLGSLFLAS